jgi:threonine dehydrogenase-like Zn-dependent dehydrogenase
MKALVYQAPYQMPMVDVPEPEIKSDEVLIRVSFSGICGSELSGFEGKNSLRKPPLIMGHEFSGNIEAIGSDAAADFPELKLGQLVTANPLLSCGHCEYCLSGRQQLCAKRKLYSAALPGSNADLAAIRADAVVALPPNMSAAMGALAEPAACAVHLARIARPDPDESALVVGAGPIGLFALQALADHGVKKLYVAELNPARMAMAQAVGAEPVTLDDSAKGKFDIVVDAVGRTSTRRGCLNSVKAGGRVIWTGLHEAETPFEVNDMIRREIVTYGAFAYSHLDFFAALRALDQGRMWLQESWTRIEPLDRGAACFQELLDGSTVAKIWLTP